MADEPVSESWMRRTFPKLSEKVDKILEKEQEVRPSIKQVNWKEPIFVFLFGWFGFFYFSQVNLLAYAYLCLIISSVVAVFSFVVDRPLKMLVFLFYPLAAFFLNTFHVLENAPALNILMVGVQICLIMVVFDAARIFASHVLNIIFVVFGGVVIFTSSVMAQLALNIKYVNLISVALLVVYWTIIAFGKFEWAWLKPVAIFVNVLLMLWIVFTPTLFGVPGTPVYDAAVAHNEGWSEMFSSIGSAYGAISKSVDVSLMYGLGDYEVSVDASANKPLGVFLENFDVTSKIVDVSPGLPASINAFGSLRASFSGDSPVVVSAKCFIEGDASKQGKLTKDNYNLLPFESEVVDCTFADVQNWNPGRYNVVLQADFDFITSAYLKSYFMDQEVRRELDKKLLSEGKSALDSFGVTDKNPISVFSGGPVRLGLGVGQQPISLVSGSTSGPTLRLTLDRNWVDGELFKIVNLNVSVPAGMKIANIENVVMDGSKCTTNSDGSQTCRMENVDAFFGSPVSVPKNILVRTSVPDSAVLLGGSALSVRSFQTSVFYQYSIKKVASVIVRAK